MVVEGSALLDETSAFIRRFVLLSEVAARVAALWIIHTYAIVVAECTPYLAISSPEKRSGKSRLLEVLATLVANPWYTGRVTAAVLYRKIDAESPTLLLDESDAAFKSGEEYAEALRGILNTGHRRGGKTTCCVRKGEGISYQDFSTFAPKTIAGIGKLPDTIADRSIPFQLKRKTRLEKVERFRLRNVRPEAERLRERLEAWVTQHLNALRDARPELPISLTDRQQDGAEPLLAIADAAGGEWPWYARSALVELCCDPQAADDSIGTRLLSDIRQIFKAQDTDRLPSAELASALAGIETSPWGEWCHGKPITADRVARQLKPFDIRPKNIRFEEEILKGYEISDFEDAWARYLPLDCNVPVSPPRPEAATPLQAAIGAGSGDFEAATRNGDVASQKRDKSAKNALCSGVAASETDTMAGPEEEL